MLTDLSKKSVALLKEAQEYYRGYLKILRNILDPLHTVLMNIFGVVVFLNKSILCFEFIKSFTDNLTSYKKTFCYPLPDKINNLYSKNEAYKDFVISYVPKIRDFYIAIRYSTAFAVFLEDLNTYLIDLLDKNKTNDSKQPAKYTVSISSFVEEGNKHASGINENTNNVGNNTRTSNDSDKCNTSNEEIS